MELLVLEFRINLIFNFTLVTFALVQRINIEKKDINNFN